MKKGIDISYHNGTINMEQIKKSGIEFIILRIGAGTKLDSKFFENYNKAMNLGIPVGIYLYSYALNTQDALQEANFVLNMIKNIKLEYPIFLDMEDADNYKLKNNISYDTCINICEIFCNRIEEEGYYVGIYANLDWLNTKINSKKLDRFDKWVAQWSNRCTYKKEYGMWQYSDAGQVLGISKNVDLNYSLKDYPSIIRKAGLNKLKINTNRKIYMVQARR